MSESNTFYRPVWTCGRYNAEKHVALMYNLLAGYSFFFDEDSADVVGSLLRSKRNEAVNVNAVARATNIAEESIAQFFDLLEQQGLLVRQLPTAEGIAAYRKQLTQYKRENFAVERTVTEKLPMDITGAEQDYAEAVEDGKTITSVMFELTYNCSEQCIHCYNIGATRNDDEESHRAEREELNIDDYKRIIDELDELGCVKVCLSGGDPFSKPIAWEIIDYLFQKEMAFDVFTNGQRIEQDAQRLADYYPRTVAVSIYSGNAEEHDTITRKIGSWRRSMNVVEELSNLAVPLNLKCCVMRPNVKHYDEVDTIAKRFGGRVQYEISITDSIEGDICASSFLRLPPEILEIVLRDSNVPLYVGPEAPNFGGQSRKQDTKPCGAGDSSFCITPEGNLIPCCAFHLEFGNVKEHTLKEILANSSTLSKWRTTTVADIEDCGEHDYCDYCNLCVGNAYSEHGSYQKASENCCYLAKIRYNLAMKMMNDGYDPLGNQTLKQRLEELPIYQKEELHRVFNK